MAIGSSLIYQAILRQASGDSNFELKFTTRGYPISQVLKDRAAARSGSFIVFVIGIGFALIPAAIISFIVGEREKNLKHQQMISGMNLTAYWISNYVFDIAKAMIPMIIVIGLIYAFELNVIYFNLLFSMMMFGLYSSYIHSALSHSLMQLPSSSIGRALVRQSQYSCISYSVELEELQSSF